MTDCGGQLAKMNIRIPQRSEMVLSSTMLNSQRIIVEMGNARTECTIVFEEGPLDPFTGKMGNALVRNTGRRLLSTFDGNCNLHLLCSVLQFPIVNFGSLLRSSFVLSCRRIFVDREGHDDKTSSLCDNSKGPAVCYRQRQSPYVVICCTSLVFPTYRIETNAKELALIRS